MVLVVAELLDAQVAKSRGTDGLAHYPTPAHAVEERKGGARLAFSRRTDEAEAARRVDPAVDGRAKGTGQSREVSLAVERRTDGRPLGVALALEPGF